MVSGLFCFSPPLFSLNFSRVIKAAAIASLFFVAVGNLRKRANVRAQAAAAMYKSLTEIHLGRFHPAEVHFFICLNTAIVSDLPPGNGFTPRHHLFDLQA